MVTRGGSKALTIDQIDAALYPIAGSFSARADKEMTSITGVIHRDNWQKFLAVVLPQLLDNGWRQEDFERVKTRQMNALVQDLRSNNEEELGKERLQMNVFKGTPYGHVALGTVAGLRAITMDDVKTFARTMYTRANLTLGVSGDASDDMVSDLSARLQALPQAPAAPRPVVEARRPSGLEVEILEKDTSAPGLASIVCRAASSISGYAKSEALTTATTPISKRSRAGCSSSFQIRTSRAAGSCSRSGSGPSFRPMRRCRCGLLSTSFGSSSPTA
jgi:zinc protease